MSKSRNPGYQGGNNWGICDRCGQAYRQTELVDQHDGLRVCVHDCYDKRHPQEAVRDKGWECGGDGAAGTGLDWNGAGRLARPDVDPLSFIQEPNDAYFTTIPTGNFGEVQLYVPDEQVIMCCHDGVMAGWDYATKELFHWFSATDIEEWLGWPVWTIHPDDNGGKLYDTYAVCGASGANCPEAENLRLFVSASSMPDWVRDTAQSKDGDLWPCIRVTSSTNLPISKNWNLFRADTGYSYISFVIILDNVAGPGGLIRTSSGIFDGQQTDEGIRAYDIDGQLYIGFRMPAGSYKHPDYPGTGIEDLDFYGVSLNTDGPTIVEFHWYPDQIRIVKDNGREVYTSNALPGYYPNGYKIGSDTSNTFDLYEMFTMYPENGPLSSSKLKSLMEAFAWKYNIRVPR